MINKNRLSYTGTSGDYVNYTTRGESRKKFERERRHQSIFQSDRHASYWTE